ncbi:MAG: hypothetical protein JNL95_11075 [Chitinophagales bacterium]|nr:hypothetical protein [Chitinophagales bacterium]
MPQPLRVIITFTLLLLSYNTHAQNLVPNGDFENYYNIPEVDELNNCVGWFNPARRTTPDYFNRASHPPSYYAGSSSQFAKSVGIPDNWFGYQNAHSGNGYIGIHMYDQLYLPRTQNREYATVRLLKPLEVGETYRVEYWVSLGEVGNFWGTPPQVLFNFNEFNNQTDHIYAYPQVFSTTIIRDKQQWFKISGDFIADNGYNYLTIGNFFELSDSIFIYGPTNLGNYDKFTLNFYIDDIIVNYSPPPKPDLGPDFTMCDNEKRTLSCSLSGYNYKWSTGETTQNIVVNNAGAYIVTVERKGVTNSDTIIVTTIPSPKINLGIDTGICTSDSIDITLTSEEGSYFIWKPSDSTTQSIHVKDFGTYSVHSLLENGCSSDDTIRIYNNCPPCFSELNVFPNPVKELLQMSFIYNYDKQHVKYRLISDIGQVILSDYVDLKKGLNKLNVELPVLNTGVYFLEMNVECGKMRCPIMIKQAD